ncbi:MAG: SDR family oxidoreductase [Bacteroidetes bacterium]|nr:SDR family oxidoreductase [Bacteroidota bacterium]MCL2302562.1 SDR family oxidoreductase [Lentimicrobiaceae bacterium]
MKKYFENKAIWITGASSGIGEACAYELSKQRAKLILTALEEDILQQVKEKCLQCGAQGVYVLPANLAQLESLEHLAEKAWSCFGAIDLIFNNAGISQRATTIDTDLSVIKKIMDVNYFAPVILTKAILPKMIANGGGQLAVTTSISGKFGFPLRSAYCSSKHALYGFFETVAAEYFNNNIRVTIVCPGRVQTNISFYALEKDGKQHGKLDPGQAKGVTAQQVAKKIVRAFERKKPEVLVGKSELLMVYIKRFFPGLCRKITRKIKAM